MATTQLLLTLGLTDEDWSAWYRIFSEQRFAEVAASAILQWTRQQLDEAGRSEQMLMILNDDSYDTLQFWPGLPERTIGVVRPACNRCPAERGD